MIASLKRGAHARARAFGHIDWFLFLAALLISLLGLATMRSFGHENFFFERQIIWICVAVGVFFVASLGDYSFLRRTSVVVGCYIVIIVLRRSLLRAFGLAWSWSRVFRGNTLPFCSSAVRLQPRCSGVLVSSRTKKRESSTSFTRLPISGEADTTRISLPLPSAQG